jgi:PhzF family phenazine biosynthesis protein
MQTVRALLVDAFTDEPLAGNAAGVVPDASGLADDQMQAVARELAVSETAFVTDSDVADRRLRFFTPDQEVDLCGHATVATHAHLHEDGALDATSHTFETNVGTLAVEIESDGTVWMTQADPEIAAVEPGYDRLGEVLGTDPAALSGMADDLPVAVASTGFPFLVVPVTFLEPLGGADPDRPAVEALCEEFDVMGVYAFTFDTLSAEATLHGRAWVPLAGIPEDPVTGTASGAVGAYLREFDAFESFPEELTCEQGQFVDRPGRVAVRVGEEVRVGGRATTALDGRLAIPEVGDGEILRA